MKCRISIPNSSMTYGTRGYIPQLTDLYANGTIADEAKPILLVYKAEGKLKRHAGHFGQRAACEKGRHQIFDNSNNAHPILTIHSTGGLYKRVFLHFLQICNIRNMQDKLD